MAEFFGDPLLVPAYFYLLGYGIAWAIAFVLARLLMKQGGIERAATRAWQFAIVLHIISGTALIAWICFRAIPRVAEWWHVPLYLILYVLILILDICLLVTLSTQRVKKDKVNTPTPSRTSKSLNPKKKS